MRYRVLCTRTALKQLKKLDKTIASFIISYIEEKLVDCNDPRMFGKSIQGNLRDKWRYRVGDYRIIAQIDDERIIITVVEIGHRKEIYYV